MKRNVTIAGAKYTGVPSIMIPLTDETGNAVFCEVSDTTATAADVATGKTFYSAAGTLTTGTATGGSGTATDPGFTVNLTQTDGQTIVYDSLDSKITATTGTMSIKPGSFTANFDITPASGYDAGNLSTVSHTFTKWSEVLTVTADPAVKSVENKFTFSKADKDAKTPVKLTIHGTEYTLKQGRAYQSESFFNLFYYSSPTLYFSVRDIVDGNVCKKGQSIYTYLTNHGMKMSDSNNNWVVVVPDITSNYWGRNDSNNSCYTFQYTTGFSAGKNVSDKTKYSYDVYQDFKKRFDNGETFTFEFVDTWDK